MSMPALAATSATMDDFPMPGGPQIITLKSMRLVRRDERRVEICWGVMLVMTRRRSTLRKCPHKS